MAQSSKAKPRLGRGLSSLISVSELPVEKEIHDSSATGSTGSSPFHADRPGSAANGEASSPPAPALPVLDGTPLMIPIDNIGPNPHQPRKTIKESAIAELALSLKSSGIIQPIIVRRVEDRFELIAGERRWLAAKLAGFSEVPAVVRDVDAFAQAQMALVENIQREDLNAIERAQGYRVLMQQLGLTQAELANRMGEDRSSIANYLRLLDLAEPVRRMVQDGRLSMGHAKLLAGMEDILEQQKLAETVVAQNLSVRNLERLLETRGQPQIEKKGSGSAAHLADLEKSLTRQLGLRVQLRSSTKGKGRLILHYGSLDQFDELMQKLGVNSD